MKFAYHEIELTRRCNARCAYCMRGDMQPIDISDRDLNEFFMKTSMIHVLTLTGGEVSIRPDRMESCLALAQLYGTKINRAGILINGLVVTDRFIDVCNEWRRYVPNFNISLSVDAYHKQVPMKNLTKLMIEFGHIHYKSNDFVQRSGRAVDIPWAVEAGRTKPYWLLNGWVMEPTYLNAKGNLVMVDGSYKTQEECTIGHVSDMSYDMFTCEKPDLYVPPSYPMGINGLPLTHPNSPWFIPSLKELIIQGKTGPTYFHKDVVHQDQLTELVETLSYETTGENYAETDKGYRILH